jgi:hypothetical protein
MPVEPIFFPSWPRQYLNTTTVTGTSTSTSSRVYYVPVQNCHNYQNLIIETPIGNLMLEETSAFAHRRRTPAEPRREPSSLVESAAKARSLLLSHLTEEQRRTFIEQKWFIVIGGRTRHQYKIWTGHLVANVTRLYDNQRLCAHCHDSLPMDDHYLAQKLMLENDEEAFLAIAVRH